MGAAAARAHGGGGADHLRDAFRPLPTLAGRADDLGSTIFSFAFWIVLLFLLSSAIGGAAGGVALALKRWVFPDASLAVVWWTLVGALIAVPTVATAVDRLLGARLERSGRVARAIRGAVRGSYRAFGGPLLLPIQSTLISNMRRGAMQGMMAVVFLVLIGFFLAGEMLAPGAHLIEVSEVQPPPTAGRPEHGDEVRPRRHFIRFWI